MQRKLLFKDYSVMKDWKKIKIQTLTIVSVIISISSLVLKSVLACEQGPRGPWGAASILMEAVSAFYCSATKIHSCEATKRSFMTLSLELWVESPAKKNSYGSRCVVLTPCLESKHVGRTVTKKGSFLKLSNHRYTKYLLLFTQLVLAYHVKCCLVI